MSKKLDFEETKKVSEVKGFLGYKNIRRGLIFQIRENKSKFSKKKIESFVKMITCDYPHNYPITNLVGNDK